MKSIKNLLATAVLLLCSMVAMAQRFEVDGISYEIISEDELTVQVIGSISSEDGYSGKIDIPSTVKYNSNIYNVTKIRSSAFSNCENLTSVTIPNGVTEIGEYVFMNSTNLNEITIPSSVTKIGHGSFSNCGWMNNQPDGLVYKDGWLLAYKGDGFIGDIVIADGTRAIGPMAFGDNTSLTSVTIPNSVTIIEYGAFYWCENLKSVSMPNSVTVIGNESFYCCKSLTNITIPSSVTTIEQGAFSGSGLTSIAIPNSVTTLEGGIFYRCHSLKSVLIGDGVTTIKSGMFGGCDALTSVTIPNSVTTIEENAFQSCHALTSVTIGEGVQTIDSNAFSWCENLTDVYCLATCVPSTISNAFSNAFYDSNIETATLYVPRESIDSYKRTAPWSSFGIIEAIERVVTVNAIIYEFDIVKKCATVLEYANYKNTDDIVIPETVEYDGIVYNVTAIRESAFDGCTGLESIYLMGDVPPTVDNWNFTDTQYESVVLYVPEGTLATYQAADVWKEFKNIREFDTTGIEDVVADDACNGRPNTYYNLRGQVVEHPTQGIYIYNGKKQFVK
ncbi:MAG: leucine-rich repeat domain-containing protein [Bacteroidaceae bacterium]|nr:leucine-rich repeat domain-containing protein [Bacteroidaceae bacterium]